MGKSKNGSFAPPKGKPSGNGKETTGLRDAFAVNNLKEDEELTAKYVDETDQPAAGVPIKHINRNTDKVK